MTVSLAAPRRSVFIALGIVVGTTTMAASVSALAQGAPEPIEPEGIAESVVPFPDGTYYWSTADTRIDAGAELIASAPRPTSFVLVESPAK